MRGLEAAVLGARAAMGQGTALPFLPSSLTGFSALTTSGPPKRGWPAGSPAHSGRSFRR